MEKFLEAKRVLISAVMEGEANAAERKVPDKGIFSPVFVALSYCGTEHKGRLYIQYSKEYGCVMRASIIPNGTLQEISNYILYGSKQECLAWLRDTSNVDKLIEIYNHLAEKASDVD